MESDLPNDQGQHQGERLPSGIQDQDEWKKLQSIQNRPHSENLSKEQVKAIILDENIKHPFKRTMVPVDSDAFRWAVKITTGQIVKAKGSKRVVMHFDCCNIIWIGIKPRQCIHQVNSKLRTKLDTRAQVEKRYNPTFIPIDFWQYRNIGGCQKKLDKRLTELAEEEKDEELQTTASIRGDEIDDDNEDGSEDGEFLG